MPFSASSFLVSFTFRFFPIWAESFSALLKSLLLTFFFLVLVPRRLFCLCHEGSLESFCFFLVFLSLDLSWSSFFSRLLMVPEDPRALCFAVTVPLFLLFSFSGLRDPQGLLYNPFGLGLFLSSGLSSLVLGLSLFFLGLILL